MLCAQLRRIGRAVPAVRGLSAIIFTKESDVVFIFEDTGVICDVWAKEDIATADAFAHYAMPHTVRIIKTAHKATHIAAKMM